MNTRTADPPGASRYFRAFPIPVRKKKSQGTEQIVRRFLTLLRTVWIVVELFRSFEGLKNEQDWQIS